MFNSSLFDESTFYKQFIIDLLRAEHEVVIESPFITTDRTKQLLSVFQNLISRKVKVVVITKDPSQHHGVMRDQASRMIEYFEEVGIQVLACSNNHHRKLAILDRKILWEGSLNILSQSDSREIMRRIDGEYHALEMFEFLKLEKYL